MKGHRLRIDRDGSMRIDGVARGKLTAAEFRRINDALAAPPLKTKSSVDAMLIAPKNGELVPLYASLDSLPAGRQLARLANAKQ
jgi:hypothetical protein